MIGHVGSVAGRMFCSYPYTPDTDRRSVLSLIVTFYVRCGKHFPIVCVVCVFTVGCLLQSFSS